MIVYTIHFHSMSEEYSIQEDTLHILTFIHEMNLNLT